MKNIKRLMGGFFLLSLLALDLSENKTNEDIDDSEVLDQLDNLKGFIGKKKSLKPVWVETFIDEESHDTRVATLGEIQKIDELTFKLIVNLRTSKLIIDVVFEQLQDSSNNYIDDYAIDSAKYTYTNDASIGGDVEVTGDASIGGDVEVTGDANFKDDIKINGESALQKWNGTLQLPEGLSLVASFCKIVRNFNELQFIANFRVANNTESTITINSDSMFALFEKLPNSINNKIYGHNGNACADNTSEGTIACAPLMVNLTNGPISTDNMPRYASLYHYEGQFRFYIEGGNISVPSDYTLDFEVRISLAL